MFPIQIVFFNYYFFVCMLTPERRIPKASKPEEKETLSAHRVQQEVEVDANKTPEEKYCAMDGQVCCSNFIIYLLKYISSSSSSSSSGGGGIVVVVV